MDDTSNKTVEVFITARMPTEHHVSICINGVTQNVPTGQWTPVREDMLAAITDSDRQYKIETRQSDKDAVAGDEGASAGAGALVASDKPEGKRDGPDDTHGEDYVDKENAPQGYQPAAGVVGADEAKADVEDETVPKAPLTPPTEGDAFDADKVIEGTIGDVTARLADLTPEQLAKVKAAENDREKPRVGVLAAIDAVSKPAA